MFYKIFYKVNSILKKMFFKIIYNKQIDFGHKLNFRKRFNITIEKNGKLSIGNNVFFNNGCSINVLNEIVIEDDCIFGEDVKIYDHNHIFKYKNKLIREQGMKVGTIHIGKNCWIGSNVIILKGVEIGENCVIGAGAVISENIEKRYNS